MTNFQITAREQEHLKNVEYYETNYSEILAQYPDQWVAILGQRVVGASDDAFELIAQLKAKGVPTHQIIRRHMTTEPKFLIVPVL